MKKFSLKLDKLKTLTHTDLLQIDGAGIGDRTILCVSNLCPDDTVANKPTAVCAG